MLSPNAHHPRRLPRRPSGWAVTGLVAAATWATTACAASGSDRPVTPASPPAAAPTIASADDIDPQLLQPLVGLGPCEVDPNPVADAPPEGLVLPPDAVVTSQAVDGPLTTVRGYVPATPVQAQVSYLRRPDLDVLQAEHEVHESETLLAGPEHRLFVKVQAVCEQGSVFLAVLAPEASGAPVPVPTGGPP